MHRIQALVVLGVLIALSPFVGLPYLWLSWILPVLGLLTAAISYTLWLKWRRAQKRSQSVISATSPHEEESTGL